MVFNKKSFSGLTIAAAHAQGEPFAGGPGSVIGVANQGTYTVTRPVYYDGGEIVALGSRAQGEVISSDAY